MIPRYPGQVPPPPPVQNPQPGRVFPNGGVELGPSGTRNGVQVIFAGATGGTIFANTAAVAAEEGSRSYFTLAHYDSTAFVIETEEPGDANASVTLAGYDDEWIGPTALNFIASRLQEPEAMVASGAIADYMWPWKTTRTQLVYPGTDVRQDCIIIERLQPYGTAMLGSPANIQQLFRRLPILGSRYAGSGHAGDPPVGDGFQRGQVTSYAQTDYGTGLMPSDGEGNLLLNIVSFFYPGEPGTMLLPARQGLRRVVMPLGEGTQLPRYHELDPFIPPPPQ